MHRRIATAPLNQNCAQNARYFSYSYGCPQAEHAAQTPCATPNYAWSADEEIAYIGESPRLSAEHDLTGVHAMNSESERALG